MKDKATKAIPARRSRSYDPVQTRNSIISAGLKLFKRDGFNGTAVNDIVAEAGVTKGAFYHHFESKEDLLLLIHNDYLEYQLEIINEVTALDVSPTEKIKMVISAILGAIEKYSDNVSIFFQERRYLVGEKFDKVRARRNELEDLFRDVLAQGVEKGEFRPDIDIPVVSLGLIGMCAWTYQWYTPKGRLKIDHVARIFGELAAQGICTSRE